MREPQALIDVFVAYSPKDEALLNELQAHLALLRRQGMIHAWHVKAIDIAGSAESHIDEHLQSAHLILLLISPSFLASDYCYGAEMKHALERGMVGEAIVIPILARPADLVGAPFGAFAALPRSGTALTSWSDRDEAWSEIVRGMRAAIVQKLNGPTSFSRSPSSLSVLMERDAPTRRPHVPHYPDERTRLLSEQLEAARARKSALLATNQETADIDQEILTLRRAIREGGQLKAGDSLGAGRYLLLDLVGRGGFAVVWRALDRERNELVAIKVLHQQLAGEPLRCERFLRGARIMAELRHEAVLGIIEPSSEEDGYFYFIMEFAVGGDLRRAVIEQRVRPEGIVPIILLVGDALALAHSRGIVHRDVKPANILLDAEGAPKLTDFDLVGGGNTTGGTRTGALGTFLYAAPEQMLRPQDAGPQADVYGLGMTALFGLSGAELPMTVIRDADRFIDSVPCSSALKAVLKRAVAWDEGDRFGNAGAFCEALSAAFSLEGPTEERTSLYKAPPGVLSRAAAAAARLFWWSKDTADADVTERIAPGKSEIPNLPSAAVADVGAPDRESSPPALPRSERAAPERDLRGQNLAGLELCDADLRDADLSNATLTATDLSGAHLERSRLHYANLEKANLKNADLHGADLSFARLLGADLQGASLDGATLRAAKLVGAKLDEDASLLEALREAGAAPPEPDAIEPTISAALSCLAIAWAPGGDLLAAGYEDGSLRLWERATGRMLRRIPAGEGAIHSVAFSANGSSLVTACGDHKLRVWHVPSSRLLRVLEGHTSSVRSVSISPNGALIASASLDKTVRIWDLDSGRSEHVLKGHSGGVECVTFGRRGRVLASGGADGSIRLWSVTSGKPIQTLKVHSQASLAVAFNDDDSLLASGAADNTVLLWDVQKGSLLHRLTGPASSVRSVAISKDGATLAAGSADNNIYVWGVRAATLVDTLSGHTGAVNSVSFGPDGVTLASGSYDCTLRLWTVTASGEGGGPLVRSQSRALRVFRGTRLPVHRIAFSPTGAPLASGSSDGAVRLWDMTLGSVLVKLEGPPGPIHALAFSPDGSTLASGTGAGSLRLWSVASGLVLRVLEGHTRDVRGVAWSNNGKRLASGAADGTLRLWSAADGQAITVIKTGGDVVNSIALSPNGATLASAGSERVIHLWDAATGVHLRSLMGPSDAVEVVAFSPDGGQLASGSRDGMITLWDLETGHPQRSLAGHKSSVDAVDFSPDGRTLASGSSDHTVRLWNVATGEEVGLFEGHEQEVNSIAFSPKGVVLATASSDSTVRLWEVSSRKCLATLVHVRDGWAAFTAEGRYRINGDIAGAFWHVIGLCRFEPGELDAYLPSPLRVPDGEPLFTVAGSHSPLVARIRGRPELLRELPLATVGDVIQSLREVRALNEVRTQLDLPLPRIPLLHTLASSEPPAGEQLRALAALLGMKDSDDVGVRTFDHGISLLAGTLSYPEPFRENSIVLVAIDLSQARDAEPARIRERLERGLEEAGQQFDLPFLILASGAVPKDILPADILSLELGEEDLKMLLFARHAERALAGLLHTRGLLALSPYEIAGAVREEDMFFGRVALLRELERAPSLGSIVVGPRRVGKTSLLKRFERSLGSRRVGIEVTFLDLLGIKEHGRAARELARRLDAKVPTGVEPEVQLVELLRSYYKTGRKGVILIDEVDGLLEVDARMDYPLMKGMRVLQAEGVCSFVLAGYMTVYRETLKNSSPLRNFATLRTLGPLEPEAARDLATVPMTRLGVRYSDPRLPAAIVEKTGGYPSFIQLFCDALLKELRGGDLTLTSEHLRRAERSPGVIKELDAVFRLNASKGTRILVHGLLPKDEFSEEDAERALARAVARPFPFAILEAALLELELFGFVKRAGPRFTWSIPLLRDALRYADHSLATRRLVSELPDNPEGWVQIEPMKGVL